MMSYYKNLSVPLIYSMLMLVMSIFLLPMGVLFMLNDTIVFLEWDLLNLMSVSIMLTFLLDWMSLMFMGTVLLISSMVSFYSYSYMEGDINISRFIILVFLFVVSMILLILSPNMVSILLGWDGLGLVSYCLVIYYQNMKSASAGMLTVLSNRLGDVAILLCISWMFNYGGWNFYYLQYMYSEVELMTILLLVVVAALTKSAQIPFSAWLPAAMAAPTPVSSLVHSSTLVTAGVYLLIRFNELLGINFYLLLISVLTLFMSGAGANLEMDLKKIIALSTLSQLGVMMMTLSIGLYELAFFHLISHALFKSLLFLCAGLYIHSNYDTQDIRMLGGFSIMFPTTSLFFIGCSMSLCGFPFLAGFYSKDLILESFFMMNMNMLVYSLVFLGTMFTITYSARLVYYLFSSGSGISTLVHKESDLNMIIPMGVLFICSIMAGSLFNWVYLPSLSVVLPYLIKWSILFMGLVFLYFAWSKAGEYYFNTVLSFVNMSYIWFIGSMWFLPMLSAHFLAPSLKSGLIYFKYMDNGWLEEMGGQGGMLKLMKISSVVDGWSILNLKAYLFMVFIFVLFFILFMYFYSS
uniref:NADH-ubiquinone oxidoreductase chain 5 n=1 Tax=Gomphiocephalus hodgsoni TaxID=221270 RepID=Q85QQ7_GOMHO|nr:NADH dehydrogenase subunit 5 [Gomphiocephalus hodgsoni]AAO43665.1 NADH dehydrogenase subunit 5 [Gomphiocephalus hodgsoni]